jgi:hypothetical protein
VATDVLSDSDENIIDTATKHLLTNVASIGEVQAALLAAQIAASCGYNSLILEEDALTISSHNLFAIGIFLA